jgi:hypothetical protein
MRTNGRMLTVPRVPLPPNTAMNPPPPRGSLVATLLGAGYCQAVRQLQERLNCHVPHEDTTPTIADAGK